MLFREALGFGFDVEIIKLRCSFAHHSGNIGGKWQVRLFRFLHRPLSLQVFKPTSGPAPRFRAACRTGVGRSPTGRALERPPAEHQGSREAIVWLQLEEGQAP
jgi:hypothetical protein